MTNRNETDDGQKYNSTENILTTRLTITRTDRWTDMDDIEGKSVLLNVPKFKTYILYFMKFAVHSLFWSYMTTFF